MGYFFSRKHTHNVMCRCAKMCVCVCVDARRLAELVWCRIPVVDSRRALLHSTDEQLDDEERSSLLFRCASVEFWARVCVSLCLSFVGHHETVQNRFLETAHSLLLRRSLDRSQVAATPGGPCRRRSVASSSSSSVCVLSVRRARVDSRARRASLFVFARSTFVRRPREQLQRRVSVARRREPAGCAVAHWHRCACVFVCLRARAHTCAKGG